MLKRISRIKHILGNGATRLEKGAEITVATKAHVPLKHLPLRLFLGNSYLDILCDPFQTSPEDPIRLIVLGQHYLASVSGHLSLGPGESVVLGRNPQTDALFDLPQLRDARQVELSHKGDLLVVRNLQPQGGLKIQSLPSNPLPQAMQQKRLGHLQELEDIYGGPLKPLQKAEALSCIQEAITHLEKGVYRPQTTGGKPGALLDFPPDLTPIIIGDLHGQYYNVMKALSSGCFLQELKAGRAYLLVLGDMVHSDTTGEMDCMEKSLITMDLLLKLMARFPNQVFMLQGNHDSFSAQIRKGGVQQGLVWMDYTLKNRGGEFKTHMQRLYDLLPLAARSQDYLAVHAGPPMMRVSMKDVIHARDHHKLTYQLMNNRVNRPHHLSGYARTDVKKFRKSLEVEEQTPLIVGHNPLSDKESLWMNAAKIKNHHILYGSRPDQIPVFTRLGTGVLAPLVFF